ncbi:MAG: YabP/YqfC family sporulation protein [Bacillota bacterium]
MDLFERMKDIFGGGVGVFDVRVQIVDFRNVGVFGSCKVSDVSKREIIVLGSNFEVVITGENLKIARCESGEIYVSGEIASVEKRGR